MALGPDEILIDIEGTWIPQKYDLPHVFRQNLLTLTLAMLADSGRVARQERVLRCWLNGMKASENLTSLKTIDLNISSLPCEASYLGRSNCLRDTLQELRFRLVTIGARESLLFCKTLPLYRRLGTLTFSGCCFKGFLGEILQKSMQIPDLFVGASQSSFHEEILRARSWKTAGEWKGKRSAYIHVTTLYGGHKGNPKFVCLTLLTLLL